MSSALSACGCCWNALALHPDLGVDLLVGRGDRGVLAQRHRERPGEQTRHTADDDGVGAGAGRDPRDQCGVADQSVHRAERRRAQPAARHIGVPVIEAVRRAGGRDRLPPVPTRPWTSIQRLPVSPGLAQVCLRLPHHSFRGARYGLPSGMTTTAEHLRNTLDGRWRDVKNRMREELSTEVFRPHYTPEHRHRPHQGGASS